MEQRREDDMVDNEGQPVSPAQQAIWDEIKTTKAEVVNCIEKSNRRTRKDHEDEHHHPALTAELMTDLIGSVAVSKRVVDALEGPLKTTLDGRTIRIKEEGMISQVQDIRVEIKEVKTEMKNGVKHRAELTKGQYGLVIAVIGLLGTIAAALLGS